MKNTLLFILILFSRLTWSQTYCDSLKLQFQSYDLVENTQITNRNYIENNGYTDSVLFVNVTFEKGQYLKGVNNLYFCNCTFGNNIEDSTATSAGVQFIGSDKEPGNCSSSNNITFDGCTFKNSKQSLLYVGREKSNPEYCDHTNIVVKNSNFRNWSRKNYTDFDHHAIYMMGSDAIIENNTFTSDLGGAAISIRSSGKVINNYIFFGDTVFNNGDSALLNNNRIAIHYESKLPPGISDSLIIEDNEIYTSASDASYKTYGAIAIYGSGDSCDEQKLERLVSSIVVKNNSITVTNDQENAQYSGIRVNEMFDSPHQSTSITLSNNVIDDKRVTTNSIDIKQYTNKCPIDGFSLTNNKSSLSAKVKNGRVLEGNPIIQYDWHNWDDQRWVFDTLQTRYEFKIRNLFNGLVLAVDDNLNVVQEEFNNSNDQKWYIMYQSDSVTLDSAVVKDSVRFKSLKSSTIKYTLMPEGSSNSPDTKLIVYYENQSWASQNWHLEQPDILEAFNYPIEWKDRVNTYSYGNRLFKVDSISAGWNAGAASKFEIPANEDGWIEMLIENRNVDMRFGLSYENLNEADSTIDFGFFFTTDETDTTLNVDETRYGTFKKDSGEFRIGKLKDDNKLFRIEREADSIHLYVTNSSFEYVNMKSYSCDASKSIIADVSLYTEDSEVIHAYSSHPSITSSSARIANHEEVLSENNTIENEIKVYPNPFEDYLLIKCSSQIKAVSIIDLNGKVYPLNGNEYETKSSEITFIDTKRFGKSLYILYIETDSGTQSFRIVK